MKNYNSAVEFMHNLLVEGVDFDSAYNMTKNHFGFESGADMNIVFDLLENQYGLPKLYNTP